MRSLKKNYYIKLYHAQKYVLVLVGDIMPECYVAKRGHQLECGKPLYMGWESKWQLVLLRTF